MKTKEFSFEREWRFAGDFEFRWSEAHGLIVPKGERATVYAELHGAGVPAAHLQRLTFVEVEDPASAVA